MPSIQEICLEFEPKYYPNLSFPAIPLYAYSKTLNNHLTCYPLSLGYTYKSASTTSTSSLLHATWKYQCILNLGCSSMQPPLPETEVTSSYVHSELFI